MHGKTQINNDRVAGEDVGLGLSGESRERRDTPKNSPVLILSICQYVAALPENVDERGGDGSHLNFSQLSLHVEGLGDCRQPPQLRVD